MDTLLGIIPHIYLYCCSPWWNAPICKLLTILTTLSFDWRWVVHIFNPECVKGISLEREIGLSSERWWGHFYAFQSGALDCSIPSNPHGNNLGLSCCNAYPPHLWNGFPQDIDKQLGCVDSSACHLWCHFCPYVRVRSQRIDLFQHGPWWLSLSFRTRGNGQRRRASHHGISLCPCVRPPRVVCQRAHTVGSGYLNHNALTQI